VIAVKARRLPYPPPQHTVTCAHTWMGRSAGSCGWRERGPPECRLSYPGPLSISRSRDSLHLDARSDWRAFVLVWRIPQGGLTCAYHGVSQRNSPKSKLDRSFQVTST
jgi:hypothetical protein